MPLYLTSPAPSPAQSPLFSHPHSSSPAASYIPFRRTIKWFLLQSSAGTVEFLDDEDFETIEVGKEVPAEADFGLALNGDSMEPRYHDKTSFYLNLCSAIFALIKIC